MSRRNQSPEPESQPEESPEELRDRIADEAEHPEETPPPQAPASPTATPPFSPASEPHDSSAQVRRHLDMMQQTIDLLTQRHEQTHRLMTAKMAELDALIPEVKTTMDLCQQMIGRQDEQVENLGLATGALMRMEQQFSRHLAEVREHLSNRD